MSEFLKYYDLEKYLFEDVGPRFRRNGLIDPTDLFMIFIWKSNRAKTIVRDKLKKRTGEDFSVAVATISRALFSAQERKERLAILMRDWGLRLPMASAILTVLYPDEFTVYDARVCRVLDFTQWNMPFSDNCWSHYEEYKSAVCHHSPADLSLRDRDRCLWGKSFYEDAKKDAR
jgi:hypothetical protein